MSKENKKHITSYEAVISQRDRRLKKGHKPMIGIDIGSSTVKIVQMKKNNKVYRCGIEMIPEGMVNQGRIEASRQLTDIIKNSMKANKIKGNQCSLCISGNEVIVRELKLPEMNENQIMENIKHEITSFLPLNHDEYCIDYKVLEYMPALNSAPGKMRIMVAAVPNAVVHSYINMLKRANLKVAYVDVLPNIAGKLVKWVKINHSCERNFNNIGIIDFGARTTNITILKDDNYIIHKSIANGGDYLTSQIAEKLNIDFMEAESFKKKANFFESNFRNNECLFIKNIIDFLMTDIDRTIEFYKNRNGQNGLDRIYIMGGGSLLKGLPGYIKERLNVEVAYMSDMLQQFQRNFDYADKVAIFPQAIGVTLREE